jgi:hypothetical protein
MDPRTLVPDGWDPAIDAILTRAGLLSADEIVALARGYAAPADPAFDRTRVLAIARSRANRAQEVRTLERCVAASIGASLPVRSARALRRLGLMAAAERAVTDAAMAVLLRDRLGAPAAAAISQPWSVVR